MLVYWVQPDVTIPFSWLTGGYGGNCGIYVHPDYTKQEAGPRDTLNTCHVEETPLEFMDRMLGGYHILVATNKFGQSFLDCPLGK